MSRPRIVVLGGAGDMGYRAVKELVASQKVDVVIADYRVERAQALAGSLTPAPEVRFVDAQSRQSLLAALEGANVAVNCIGPFYRYADKVLPAAIAAGVNYVDICDDDDATVKLLSFDSMARRRGTTAIIGMGWTPGLSNLLARRGADRMDQVTDIDITWVGSTADSEGQAVIAHVIHAVTRDVPIFQAGEWVTVPAMTGLKEVEFPPPIGRVQAYYTGHPEPVTIPRFLANVQNVTLRGYLLPADIQALSRGLVDLDLVSTEKKVDAMVGLLQPLLPLLSRMGQTAAPAISGLRVDVAGAKDGHPVHYSFVVEDTMDRLTGIPPAIVALMLASGEIELPGVVPPEGGLPVERILSRLAERDIEIEEV